MTTGRTLEAHMIEPLRSLMNEHMNLDVVSEEFSAGYGVADLVGATISKENCGFRRTMGVAIPLDHRHLIEVLLTLRAGIRRSIQYVVERISFSESTLRKKVLPQMTAQGIVVREPKDYVRLTANPPKPVERIVAIEAKQTKWREAILQARRYTFFADQSYVAVWSGTAPRVDRALLYRHRLGLIVVDSGDAKILLKAPMRKPREPKMNYYCAEYLYRQALGLGILDAHSVGIETRLADTQ